MRMPFCQTHGNASPPPGCTWCTAAMTGSVRRRLTLARARRSRPLGPSAECDAHSASASAHTARKAAAAATAGPRWLPGPDAAGSAAAIAWSARWRSGHSVRWGVLAPYIPYFLACFFRERNIVCLSCNPSFSACFFQPEPCFSQTAEQCFERVVNG